MFESEAYRSLSGRAMWVLQRFLQKRRWEIMKRSGQKYKIFVNDDLEFTYSEAIHFQISRSRFHEIIRVLYERGFIEIEHQGGGVGRDPSKYKLIDDWRYWPDITRKKERVLQAGLDVRSRQKAKSKKST
jgi:hypothetical protein